MIDDLSYSNLVKIIQNDESIGSDVISECASELQYLNEKIQLTKIELNNLENRKNSLINATHSIVKHLKKELPLYVKRDTFIILVSKDTVEIKSNMIQ